MELQTSLDNRKQLVKILEEFNGEPLVYTGTPSFTYEGTGFRILRDGTIDCYDESILPALKKNPAGKGNPSTGSRYNQT